MVAADGGLVFYAVGTYQRREHALPGVLFAARGTARFSSWLAVPLSGGQPSERLPGDKLTPNWPAKLAVGGRSDGWMDQPHHFPARRCA